METAGFPRSEFAVAANFGFSCFGFFVSFLLFLPLAMVLPSYMQRPAPEWLWSFTDCKTVAQGGG